MELKTWTEEITVEGAFDNTTIQTKIREMFEGKSFEHHGYCLKVHDVKILEVKASIKGTLSCRVSIVADVALLKQGQRVYVIVESVEPARIYCLFKKFIRVIIPDKFFGGYEHKAVVGEPLPVEILRVRFQNGNYNAIGAIINDFE